jgi:hypothetical protein
VEDVVAKILEAIIGVLRPGEIPRIVREESGPPEIRCGMLQMPERIESELMVRTPRVRGE